jgi:hypothetical protein
MMKRLVCLLVFLVAGAAWAQRPAELKQLDPFAGSWSCKGTAYAGEWGPEHPITMTINTAWAYDGMWLKAAYKEMKTAKNPKPMTGEALWGYDTEVKKYVGGWVDSTGAYQTQQGEWKGDTLTLEGPYHMGMTATGRDTFTMKGKNQIDHVFELEMKGTWKKVESDTCKRK